MRVAVAFLGKRGGGGRYSLELATALSLGADVDLRTVVAAESMLAPALRALCANPLEIRTYATPAGFVFGSIARAWRTYRRVRDYVRVERIDVLIMGMIHPWSPLVCRAARAGGARVITVVHEPEPHPGDPFMIALIMKRCIRDCIGTSDAIVALTEASARAIVATHRQVKPHVIPHGVFAHHAQEQPRALPVSVPARVLFFGRIAPYKGLGTLLDAMAPLQSRFPGLVLEIWGDGDLSPYSLQLRRLKDVRIENRWVTDDEIGEVFRRCDVCVLPYLQSSQSGIVGIAQAAGMPIVAFPQPGMVEQLSAGGGLLCGGSNAAALVDSIASILSDSTLYAAVSRDAIEAARATSWATIAGRFVDLAKTLLRSS